ncbi:hypothetical protein [Nitrospira moscoviensis]|uniref:Uncharacterized protein n=1 Tax=Nitrospira moscoviensis TaxID=42253 RepID=A0A0K2GHV4_NITMO|nr:hypothetical protein [Nitrospira moscoviensis]ALA60424.1 hypothetical protein NITMOv2_4040 [Nitrospira moscoviensis]
MKCARCASLVVTEVFVDYHADGGGMSFLGYRCPICGDIMDPTILRHRDGACAPTHSHARRRPGPLLVDGRR